MMFATGPARARRLPFLALVFALLASGVTHAADGGYTEIEYDTEVKGNFVSGWGVGHYYYFEVDIDGEFTIEASVGGDLSAEFRIYGPDSLNESNLVYQMGLGSKASDLEEIEAPPLTAGTYYINVRPVDSTGTYTMKIVSAGRDGGVEELKFEGDPPSATADGLLSVASEVDWYSFTADSEFYHMEMTYTQPPDDEITEDTPEGAKKPASDLILYLYESDQITRVQGLRWDTWIDIETGNVYWGKGFGDWYVHNDNDDLPGNDVTPQLTIGDKYYLKVVGRNSDLGGYTFYVTESEEGTVTSEDPDLYVSDDFILSDVAIPNDGKSVQLTYTYGMTGKGEFENVRLGVIAASSRNALLTEVSPDPGTSANPAPDGMWPGPNVTRPDGEHDVISIETGDDGEQVEYTLTSTFFLDPEAVLGTTADGYLYLTFFIDEDDYARESDETNNYFPVVRIRVGEEAPPSTDPLLVELVSPEHGSRLSDPSATVWGFVYDRPAQTEDPLPEVDVLVGGRNIPPDSTTKSTVQFVTTTPDGFRKSRFYKNAILGNGTLAVAARAQDRDGHIMTDEITLVVNSPDTIDFWSPLYYETTTAIRFLNLGDSELGLGVEATGAVFSQALTLPANESVSTNLDFIGFRSADLSVVGGLTVGAVGAGSEYLRADSYVSIGEERLWVPLRASAEASADTGAFFVHTPGATVVTHFFLYNYTDSTVSPRLLLRSPEGALTTVPLGSMPSGTWWHINTENIFGSAAGAQGSFAVEGAPLAWSAISVNETFLEVRLQNPENAARILGCPYYSTATQGSYQRNTLLALHNPGYSTVRAHLNFGGDATARYSFNVPPYGSTLIDFLGIGTPAGEEGGFDVVCESGSLLGDAWVVTTNPSTGEVVASARNWLTPVDPYSTNRIATVQANTRSGPGVSGTPSDIFDTELDTMVAVYNGGVETIYPRIRIHRNDAKADQVFNISYLPAGEMRLLSLKYDILPILYGTPNENLEGWMEVTDADTVSLGCWIVDEKTGREQFSPIQPGR